MKRRRHTLSTADQLFPFVITLLLSLTGCSTTVYNKSVESFSTTLTTAADTFESYRQAERQATIDVAVHRALSKNARMTEAKDCQTVVDLLGQRVDNTVTRANVIAALKQSSCHLQIIPIGTDSSPYTWEFTTEGTNGTQVFKHLKVYAQGLTRLVSSQDAEAVRESAGQLSAALSQLAGSVGKAAGTPMPAGLTEPLTAIVQWIGFNYVNYVKWRALQNVISKANPLIAGAQQTLSDEIMSLHLLTANERLVALEAQSARFRSTGKSEDAERYEGTARAAIEQQSTLQQFMRQDPGDVMVKMQQAHQKLYEAVTDPTTQAETVFAAIQEFAKAVEDVKNAVEALPKGVSHATQAEK